MILDELLQIARPRTARRRERLDSPPDQIDRLTPRHAAQIHQRRLRRQLCAHLQALADQHFTAHQPPHNRHICLEILDECLLRALYDRFRIGTPHAALFIGARLQRQRARTAVDQHHALAVQYRLDRLAQERDLFRVVHAQYGFGQFVGARFALRQRRYAALARLENEAVYVAAPGHAVQKHKAQPHAARRQRALHDVGAQISIERVLQKRPVFVQPRGQFFAQELLVRLFGHIRPFLPAILRR